MPDAGLALEEAAGFVVAGEVGAEAAGGGLAAGGVAAGAAGAELDEEAVAAAF